MTIIQTLKTGQEYMKICIIDKRLSMTFPEIKIISLMKASAKYLPPAIIMLFVWQYYMKTEIILTCIAAAIAISIPIQGYFWLGKRANSQLPLTLLNWYNQLKEQIKNEDISFKPTSPLPCFMDLMTLLNLTKEHFDDYLDSDDAVE